MGDNRLKGTDAGKALGDAIAANATLKELDLSSPNGWACDVEFLRAFSAGLGANRALAKFDISSNDMCAEGGKALAEALVHNHVLTELDVSSNDLSEDSNGVPDMSGIIAIRDAISTMGALACADGRYYHEWRLNPRHGEAGVGFLQLEGRALKSTVADWGAPLTDCFEPNARLGIVVAQPALADGDLTNPADLKGKVALVDRGAGCSFVEKAQRVQAAGAVAMICANDRADKPDQGFTMWADTRPSGITIPAIGISLTSGLKIKTGSAVTYHVRTAPRFITSAPDIDGRDEDPGVPLANGICRHCGQPKDQHRAKGALTSLNLANNALGPEGAHHVAKAIQGHVSACVRACSAKAQSD